MASVRILGPVQAWAGDQPLVLGGPRQLKLFACLVLDANRAVSSDTLIDAVWGSRRSGADNRLQMAITRLRRALEPLGDGNGPVLRTVAGGYLLSIPAGELDSELFEATLADGRRALYSGDAARAAELLSEGIRLWRGPPLAELAFEDFAQGEIRRLEELRLVALEARIDAGLQLGDHGELVGELERLLIEHPTHERFAAQLMLALYRCGRQGDALAVWQRARAHLAEQLGLEPGPPLRDLQHAILAQDPELGPTPALAEHKVQVKRSNLPVPANPLVGRRAEVARAVELLSRPNVRLLTLLGPGGVGKTRLGMEVAAELAGGYRDGVWLLALAPIADRALMISDLARLLQVEAVTGEPLEQTVSAALAERELLLVLDNFEHLLGAAGIVADVLAAAPKVAALVTSREPLRIRGEQRMAVAPLLLGDACELFLQRALEVRPELRVDEQEDRGAVERICGRLDGLPLALELAAARISVFSPRTLEARLAEGLPLPEGQRDLPERQRTLRAAIDWSYRLLDPDERKLFASLAPFVGGVRIDCVESMWGLDAVDGLISLADKSLLGRREDRDGEPRFWMLETIREFALERAAVGSRSAEVAERHARWFFSTSEQAAPHLIGADQREWLDRLEADHPNLRAAVEHLTEHAPGAALLMVSNLGWFWEIRGYYLEARRRLNAALAAAPEDSPGRGLALVFAGRVAWNLGEPEAARSLLLEALDHALDGDERFTIVALTNLGIAAAALGDHKASVAHHREAIARARAAADDWALALALHNHAVFSYAVFPAVVADLDQARRLLEETLAIRRRIRDPRGIVTTAINLAYAALSAGEIEYADSLNNEALARAREIEYRPFVTAALANRVQIALMRGQLDDALAHFGQALTTGVYNYVDLAELVSLAGTIAAQQHEPIRAATLWAAAEQAAARSGVPEGPPSAQLRARWEPEAGAEVADPDAWAAAWQAGTELSLDDALALAANGPETTTRARPKAHPALGDDAEP